MQLIRLVEGLPGHNFNFSEEIASPFTQYDFPNLSQAVSSRDFAVITEAVDLFEQKILTYFQTQGTTLKDLTSLAEVDLYLGKTYPGENVKD